MEQRRKMAEEVMSIFRDDSLTPRQRWDEFYKKRGVGDSYEWYADYHQLRHRFLRLLPRVESKPTILVPGCGTSHLSRFMYDDGYESITNIDFCDSVIRDMETRHQTDRPNMKWLYIPDMTDIRSSFDDATFDIVVDKGALDSLPLLKAVDYLSEVKRVLKVGGKFICLTLATSGVLGLLFPNLRSGWKLSIHFAPPKSGHNQLTFLITAEKEDSLVLHELKISSSSFQEIDDIHGLYSACENENTIRRKRKSELGYSFEDLIGGASGGLSICKPGRRDQLTCCGKEFSCFLYRAIVLDAKEERPDLEDKLYVHVVPKVQASKQDHCSIPGQWSVVSRSKAKRLVMVFLDCNPSKKSFNRIKNELHPLVIKLSPEGITKTVFNLADGTHGKIICQVKSSLTGGIVVDEITIENELALRRLMFERTSNPQSEVFMFPIEGMSKKSGPSQINWAPVHSHFLGLQNYVIVGGIIIIPSCLQFSDSKRKYKAVVVGIGAGSLPMFLNKIFPSMHIEVVEIDPLVVDIAKKHFGFVEHSKAKVTICDGIEFIKAVDSNKIDVLIIDVDSSDTRCGIVWPPSSFMEESFLRQVKDSLCDQGLLVLNLVTSFSTVRENLVSTMKKVFTNLFHFVLVEEFHEIIYAVKSDSHVDIDREKYHTVLKKLPVLEQLPCEPSVKFAASSILPLK